MTKRRSHNRNRIQWGASLLLSFPPTQFPDSVARFRSFVAEATYRPSVEALHNATPECDCFLLHNSGGNRKKWSIRCDDDNLKRTGGEGLAAFNGVWHLCCYCSSPCCCPMMPDGWSNNVMRLSDRGPITGTKPFAWPQNNPLFPLQFEKGGRDLDMRPFIVSRRRFVRNEKRKKLEGRLCKGDGTRQTPPDGCD